jgi:hypothetical protein
MIPSQSRWHTVLAIASLLVIGAALGVTVDRLLHKRQIAHGGISRAEMHADPMSVLDRELDLRPEQRARVAAIVETRQGAINRVWLETHTALQATLDSAVSEVAAVLDANQAARFRALVEELHPGGRVDGGR